MAKKYMWTDDTPQGFINDELEEIHDRLSGVNEDTTNKVGIGTDSPTEALHVLGKVRVERSANPNVVLEDQTTSQEWQVINVDSNFMVRDLTAGSIYPFQVHSGASDDALVIDSAGEVGVGTDSPSHDVDVVRSNATLRLHSPGTGGSSWSRLILSTGDSDWRILNINDRFELYEVGFSGSTPILSATNSGRVGILTKNPDGALDVDSTSGGLVVPRMTTTQRDALSPVAGTIIYNTTTSKHEGYDGTSWNAFY